MLDRDAALAHPLIDEVFHITVCLWPGDGGNGHILDSSQPLPVISYLANIDKAIQSREHHVEYVSGSIPVAVEHVKLDESERN